MSNGIEATLDVEQAVRDRYTEAAQAREESLCCPVQYDPTLLKAIPAAVLERDYGCGDPSAHLRKGETVLDLGSGAGKICFIASQVVGPAGRVIGVDMNREMLALARGAAPEVAERVGFSNVEFRRGRIQDLGLDLDRLDAWLQEHPVGSADQLARLDAEVTRLRHQTPLVADDSVDVVVSNCVLNLVRADDKRRLFAEILRVLRRGGRAVISDIVCDEDVPEHLQRDPELWSGCVSGALREDRFLEAFEEAGFYGVEILGRDESPWRTVGGLEFRGVTVAAFKGKDGPCVDRGHAVIYRGPFREVTDDDGHVLRRGARMAVCEKTFAIYAGEPYRAHVDLVPPRVLPSEDEAGPFPCDALGLRRHPRETKGDGHSVTTDASDACATGTGDSGRCC